MDAKQVKCRRDYITVPVWPGVAPERIRVLRKQDVGGVTWFQVKFLSDGGRVCMHPTHFQPV